MLFTSMSGMQCLNLGNNSPHFTDGKLGHRQIKDNTCGFFCKLGSRPFVLPRLKAVF